MKHNIKAIIFDCDGTLIDSEEAHLASWQSTLKQYGVHLSKEDHARLTGTADFSVACEHSKKIGCPPEKLFNEKCAHFLEHLKKGLPPISGTVAFVRHLIENKEAHSLKLAVASAAIKTDVLHNLRSLALESSFDLILSGHDDLHEYKDPEGVNKPKPYIYLHAAKLLNLKPQECVVIEDSYTGVTAGVNAGCITVAIPHTYSKNHDLSHASLQLETLAGFTLENFLEHINKILC